MHPDSREFKNLPVFQQLVVVIAALRNPDGGCPWDLQQTHQSLTPFLIEEAYECIEALELQEDDKIREELGDLLLQIVLHAQLARERKAFDIDAVIQGIVSKMIRRHPHVFKPDQNLDSASAVLQQWDQIKKQEKDKQKSHLDGVSSGLPSLPQASLLQERAARNGFTYPDAQAAWNKLLEEIEEFKALPSLDELGDIFFALVSLGLQHGLDPEAALRSTNRKFRQRYQLLEQHFPEGLQGKTSVELAQAWKECTSFLD